jgi:hypothetical protein
LQELLFKKAGHYHSFGLTFDRPLQLASAQITHLRKLRISSSALQKRSSNRHTPGLNLLMVETPPTTGGNGNDFTQSRCVPRPIGDNCPVRRLRRRARLDESKPWRIQPKREFVPNKRKQNEAHEPKR